MKRGYKRLLLLSIVLIIIFLADIFLMNFFSSYKMVFFQVALLIFFDYFYVIEKDKHRFYKELLFEIILFIISFFLLYYLLGFVVGLAKNTGYLSFNGLKNFIIPVILYTILREKLRYNMLAKADGNELCSVIVVIVFILIDMSNVLYYVPNSTKYDLLRIYALTIFPTIARNISYSYISKTMGMKPLLVFDLTFALYPFLILFIPNANEYVVSIIQLIVPIIFAHSIMKFYIKKADYHLPSNYYKLKFQGACIPAIIIALLVYFYSGYFRFYSIAIASGSMSPIINKGDIVIVDQDFQFDSLEKGQVIAFKKDNIIVVHRIIKKMKVENDYVYYTKGDSNNNIDELVIEKDMVVGTVDKKIPLIGYPTVWFSER